jgi:hypothetical protein
LLLNGYELIRHHFFPSDKNYFYWLPNPFCSPQSGQVQVIALQDIPHMFSCMQS